MIPQINLSTIATLSTEVSANRTTGDTERCHPEKRTECPVCRRYDWYRRNTYHPYNLLELNELCTLDKYFYKINYSSHEKSIYKIKLS